MPCLLKVMNLIFVIIKSFAVINHDDVSIAELEIVIQHNMSEDEEDEVVGYVHDQDDASQYGDTERTPDDAEVDEDPDIGHILP